MTHRVGAISRVDPGTIEQEPHRCWGFALTIAEGVHELGESCGALDLEEDFVIVVCDFDVEVFALGLVIWVASSAWGLVAVRHVVCCSGGAVDESCG